MQPCGLTNPARQSLASSRKRVLRGGGRPPLRSVDSESRCRAIEPRNLHWQEPLLLTQAGAVLSAAMACASQSYRGTRTGRRDTRVAREPERPCHFRRDCRLESRLTNSRLIHSYVPSWWGQTTVLPRQESFASLHILTLLPRGLLVSPSLPVYYVFSGARVISPNEGNEVRRDERQRVGAFHSNVEAGELDRRTPRSEGDAVSN